MQSARVDLGYFNLSDLRIDEANKLITAIQGFAGMRTGATLPSNCRGTNSKKNLRDSKEYEFTLSGELEYVRNFNPKNLGADNAKVLISLLQPHHAGKLFLPGGCVVPVVKEGVAQARFFAFVTHDGILVGRNRYGELVLHIFDPKLFAHGGSARLYRQIGTVKFKLKDGDSLVYEACRSERLVRILNLVDSTEHVRLVHKEFGKSKLFPHLGVRGSVFFSERERIINVDGDIDVRLSAVSMKLLKDVDLFDVVVKDYKSISLTLKDRCELTLDPMIKLKTQFHMRKLKHRDIKPENIRATTYILGWNCNYIDVTDALPMTLEDGRHCGTPSFWAKEMMQGRSSLKSDIFQLGLTLAQIWRDSSQNHINSMEFSDYEDAKAKVELVRNAENWNIQLELFHDIAGLSTDLKNRIHTLLTAMTAISPDERPDIDACIDIFERIFLDYRNQQLTTSEQALVIESFTRARDCRLNLERMTLRSVRCLDNIYPLFNCVSNAMNEISDTECAVREFITTSKLQCLHGAMSKLELQGRLRAVLDGLIHSFGQLECVSARLSEIYNKTGRSELSANLIEKRELAGQQIKNIEIFKQKIFAAPLDINMMNVWKDNIHHKVEKLNASMIYFEELESAYRAEKSLR